MLYIRAMKSYARNSIFWKNGISNHFFYNYLMRLCILYSTHYQAFTHPKGYVALLINDSSDNKFYAPIELVFVAVAAHSVGAVVHQFCFAVAFPCELFFGNTFFI